MVQFFFGSLRTKSEAIDEEKSKQERDEWFYQFFDSTLANVSFQDKVKIKQISFGISVEHPTKKYGLKRPWGGYLSKNGLNFFLR